MMIIIERWNRYVFRLRSRYTVPIRLVGHFSIRVLLAPSADIFEIIITWRATHTQLLIHIRLPFCSPRARSNETVRNSTL